MRGRPASGDRKSRKEERSERARQTDRDTEKERHGRWAGPFAKGT